MIKQKWKNETVVCIASGPSLDTDDIDYIRDKDCRVIAINDNYKIAPFADVLYACDYKWWKWHEGAPEFEGEKWSIDRKAVQEWTDINYVSGSGGTGLSTESDKIITGSNSGYQAINLAYLFGANRVILTGYDMCFGKDGRSHWFGDHPDNVRSNYSAWLKLFDNIKTQGLVEVINCTRNTALQSFPIKPLREVL